jgi:hypothetical protein
MGQDNELRSIGGFLTKAEHDSESPVSIYEFTRENTHRYHTHESQVPMSMGFQGSKY